MSIPLQNGDHGRQSSERRLDAYRLRMARIRADATGESVEEVLSVFTGRGRFGPLQETAVRETGAEEAGVHADQPGSGPSASPGPSGSQPPPDPPTPALAPVIAFSDASRTSTARRRRPSKG